MTAPLRVLIVDDSAYNRRNIADILEAAGDIAIVGKAADGEEALRLAIAEKPDVITLDLEMPRMDGFTFLRILMAKQPTPVIVISSYSQKENVFKALELGAIDFVAKPDRQFSPDASIRREITDKIRLVRYLRQPKPAPAPLPTPALSRLGDALTSPRGAGLKHLVAIASSTGGPTALMEIFSRVSPRFAGAILVAQHMPDKFTRTFAERLDKKGPLSVAEAVDGERVLPRRGYICPGGMCMDVYAGTAVGELRLRVTQPLPSDRYIPSADRLFRSLAATSPQNALGVVLTGMGDDGAEGARALFDAGATVIAESEETAVVYGMPACAVRAGAVSESLPLPAIGDFVALLS